MGDLVFMDGRLIFTNTLVIAKGVGVEHRAVMQLIKKYESDFLDLESSTFKMRKFKTKGREGEMFDLAEIHATFLLTLMRNSENVVRFKKNLTKEFYEQRKIISRLISQQKNPDWQNVRADGKVVYKQKTDVIKMFVTYATSQGSKSAQMYYSNLAKMENKALFFIEQKYSNLRDILTIKQLMQACTADDVIEKALIDGMNDGLPYKEIYTLAKNRVCSFADIIGKSPVHNLSSNKKRIKEEKINEALQNS